MAMDILLAVIAAIVIIIGFFGTFVPVIPGAPLAWTGLLISYFSSYIEISITTLIICLIVAVAVSIADNLFPVAMTRKSGGSKAGMWGSTIGLIAGIFTGPWGIILGPFCGALIGELIYDHSDIKKCFRAAFGAFKGFLLGTGIKMLTVAAFIWIYIIALLHGIQNIQ